jgi:hypothetical protein
MSNQLNQFKWVTSGNSTVTYAQLPANALAVTNRSDYASRQRECAGEKMVIAQT